jgi:protein phosphatase
VTLHLRVGARSDVGKVREGNEDSLYAGRRLLAVADGVGGAVAGEVASSTAIAALEPLEHDTDLDDVLGALRAAVHGANDALRERIDAAPELSGMGTTLTAMLWHNERLGLAQVGDSRAYLLRDGDVAQITRDQTFVQMLVDEGRITADQAAHHPQRSVILSALDGREAVEPDLTLRDVAAGDRYLLCSDGLSDYVEPAALAEGLADGDPQPACDRLVQLALDAGAPDNVTCIVVDVTATDGGTDDRLPIVAGAAAELPPGDLGPTDAGADGGHGRHAQARASRSIGRRLAVVTLAVVVLVAAGIVGTVIYVHHQWYVATAEGGQTVAVYQGVQGSVLGHRLNHMHSPSDVPVTALPQDEAQQVRNGIDTSGLANAESIVATLRADACTLARTSLSPSPTPVPTASPSGHPRSETSSPATAPPWCSQ